MRRVAKKLIALISILLLSCGGNGDVTGGFGSETSTGIILSISHETDASGLVQYSIYSANARPINGLAPKPLFKDTMSVGSVDTIGLSNGEYTVVSKSINGEFSSINQRILVDSSITRVNDTLREEGLVTVEFDDTLRTKDLILFVEGSNFVFKIDSSKHIGSRYQISLKLPQGIYQSSLRIMDLRDTLLVTKSVAPFAIIAEETTDISIESSKWFKNDKDDGMLTININYPSSIPGGYADDTITTKLIPWDYSPKSGTTLLSHIQIGVGGAITFSSVPYGIYNIIASSSKTGLTKAHRVTINKNNNKIISDTLIEPTILSLNWLSATVINMNYSYLQGSDISVERDTTISFSAPIVYKNVPVGLITVPILIKTDGIVVNKEQIVVK